MSASKESPLSALDNPWAAASWTAS